MCITLRIRATYLPLYDFLGHSIPHALGDRLLKQCPHINLPFEKSISPAGLRHLYTDLYCEPLIFGFPQPLSCVLLYVSFAFCAWRCFHIVRACRDSGICMHVRYSGHLVHSSCLRAHIHSTVLGVARTSTTHLMVVVLLLQFMSGGLPVPGVVHTSYCSSVCRARWLDRPGSGAHFYDSPSGSGSLVFTSGTLLVPGVVRTLIAFPCVECDDRPSWEWRALLRFTSSGRSLYILLSVCWARCPTVLGVALTSTTHFWWSFCLSLTFRVSGTRIDWPCRDMIYLQQLFSPPIHFQLNMMTQPPQECHTPLVFVYFGHSTIYLL